MRLVGMVHLDPLPGAPGFGDSIDEVLTGAVADASALEEAGFDALMVENFGDAPFYATSVPPETVAAMTRAVTTIGNTIALPIGVNVLRNDPVAALGIAAATKATMIRVNVLTGTMYTDQGAITGDSARVGRERQRLCPATQIWADVMVKHATPPPGLDGLAAATDTWERGGADALILSGEGTGRPLDMEMALTIRSALPEAPLVVGSGATADTIPSLFEVFDTAIVGSSIKVDGVATNPIDPARAKAVVEAVP